MIKTRYKYYLNLTNGIEALHREKYLTHCRYGFIRIQSTACEQKLWSRILLDLDYDFLLNAAIGTTCVVIDYSPKKKIPRAIYQGLEFIKYVLNRRWHNIDDKVIITKGSGKSIDVTNYFRQEYGKLDNSVFKKIDYFKVFVTGDCVKIVAHSAQTSNDGNKNYYSSILKQTVHIDLLKETTT